MKILRFFLPVLFTGLIFSSPLQSAEPLRELYVTAAVSPQFKADPEWRKDIVNRILAANAIFEKKFGIHFNLKNFVDWTPQDETRATSLLIEELRALSPIGQNEVLIGFHHMSKAFGDALEDTDTVGTAQFFKGYVIIRDPFRGLDENKRGFVLAHEAAHLFGAVHSSGQDLLMNPVMPQAMELKLDPENEEIIRLTRGVDFTRGLDSLSPDAVDGLIRIYEKMIRTNPHADFYHQLGLFYRKRGQDARAISTWEEALRQEYANPEIHWELGVYYYQNGRYDSAIQEIGAAQAHFILPSQQKQRVMAFNFLGIAYFQKGNLDSAIFSWLKGLSADPDSRSLQANLALAYLQKGDNDRAIAEFQKLLIKNPEDPTSLGLLGTAYLKKGEADKALESFKSALEKRKTAAPDQKKDGVLLEVPESGILSNMGSAYLSLKRYPEAIDALQQSVKLDPENFEVHCNLGSAYIQMKRYEDGIKEIQEALRYRKDDPSSYALLAQAYSESGHKNEAMTAARQALQYAQDPKLKANLYRNIAVMHAQAGQLNEAIAEMKNALNQNWNDAGVHTQMGILYAQAGRYEEAERSFQNAVRMDPGQVEAKKALENLRARPRS